MADRLDRRTERGMSYLTGGEGPPVVFLHGIPGSALTWETVATWMQEQYRVIVPDLRGFGQSEPTVIRSFRREWANERVQRFLMQN